MRRSRKKAATGAGLALLGIVVVAQVHAGCTCSNALPPNPVPGPDGPPDLPGWYPEQPWNAADKNTRVYIEGKIIFAVDKAIIKPGSEDVLQKLLQFMNEHNEVTMLRVEGHTDSTAGDDYNQELSARRALAVCDWLVDHGVDHTRLLATGFGETRPIAPNELAEGRQENRRTEFHVAEVNGAPFVSTDVTNGGLVLEVLSKAERERLAAEAAKPPEPYKPPTFEPEGNVIKPVSSKQETEELEDAP